MSTLKYSWQQVEGACLEIARLIHNDYWTPDYIVGINRGGVIPANLLSQYLGIPMHVLHVSLRDHSGTETNAWMASDALDQKNILIIDDINDTGATLDWIKADWQSAAIPSDPRWANEIWHKNVKFATIFDNAASNSHIDYCAEEIDKRDDDVWVIFPWENFWRV